MSFALSGITQFFPISKTGAFTKQFPDPIASEIPHDWSIDLEIRLLYRDALALTRSKQTRTAQVEDWCQRAHDCLVSTARNASHLVTAWRAALLPFFLKSHFLNRRLTKPRGYAGDYKTIQMMYDLSPAGDGLVRQAVDFWALQQPCPRAVRNRRLLIDGLVKDLRHTFQSETISIVSLGSGPAAEVFECAIPNVQFTLVDIDEEAIDYVQQKANRNGVSARINTVLANVIRVVLGRGDKLPLISKQHGFYSLGLIDYFNDDLVIKLLNYIHGNLQTGGVAYLGNFTPSHPNAEFFQHALDWPLVLRAQGHLVDLVERSLFKGCPTSVGCEGEGIQLFVKVVKTDP